MPDGINYDAFSEALNDKADRDLQNVDTVSGGDAVIAFQRPTAENNYTWYRKYASGWVEQGGIYNAANLQYAVTMADKYYTLFLQARETSGKYAMNCKNLTTTGATINTESSEWHHYFWQVSGFAAA